MSTATITTNGRVWEEHLWVFSSVGGVVSHKKRTHSLSTQKTVGYTDAASAQSAAEAAAIAEGVVATYQREGNANFYSVIIETDTLGDWEDVAL